MVYVADDTAFNESFATAVERLGGARWLVKHGSEAAKAEYALHDARRKQFRALTQSTRARLMNLYTENDKNNSVAGINIAYAAINKIAKKNIIIQEFADEYVQLKTSWGGYAGYDNWVKQANNAAFGALAAYDDGVPQFEALFEQQGGDWDKFYAAVKALAALSKDERQTALKTIAIAIKVKTDQPKEQP